MGSGKTTLGRALAADLGLSFYDLDWYIRERYRLTVQEIFAQKGESGFRDLERRMLHEVAEFEDVVVALGGGTPCFFDNMAYINAQAETVYLKASPQVLAAHIRMGKGVRPLLQGKTPQELDAYIHQSLAEREPFYSQARYTLDVDLLDNFTKIQHSVALLRQLLGL